MLLCKHKKSHSHNTYQQVPKSAVLQNTNANDRIDKVKKAVNNNVKTFFVCDCLFLPGLETSHGQQQCLSHPGSLVVSDQNQHTFINLNELNTRKLSQQANILPDQIKTVPISATKECQCCYFVRSPIKQVILGNFSSSLKEPQH